MDGMAERMDRPKKYNRTLTLCVECVLPNNFSSVLAWVTIIVYWTTKRTTVAEKLLRTTKKNWRNHLYNQIIWSQLLDVLGCLVDHETLWHYVISFISLFYLTFIQFGCAQRLRIFFFSNTDQDNTVTASFLLYTVNALVCPCDPHNCVSGGNSPSLHPPRQISLTGVRSYF